MPECIDYSFSNLCACVIVYIYMCSYHSYSKSIHIYLEIHNVIAVI